jgi:hypothetical protein
MMATTCDDAARHESSRYLFGPISSRSATHPRVFVGICEGEQYSGLILCRELSGNVNADVKVTGDLANNARHSAQRVVRGHLIRAAGNGHGGVFDSQLCLPAGILKPTPTSYLPCCRLRRCLGFERRKADDAKRRDQAVAQMI